MQRAAAFVPIGHGRFVRAQRRTCSEAERRPGPIMSASTGRLSARIVDLSQKLKALEALTRPGSVRGAEGAMEDRYANLPDHVKGPNQMLGRLSPGCEGTHSVFPACNFGCKPCYHSEDANRVRVDGMHTVTSIAAQMKLLQEQRGPIGHCQLIGGEVSLLSPEDHAMALEVMRFYGRIPMSFTHGDFSYEYLRALAIRPDGTRRFDRLDFAVHFDMFMYGRKGIERPQSEMDLMPYRRRFVQMFQRLKKEHGVNYYLAHNLTVQPGNLEQVAQVVHHAKNLGFRMMSFQPAALQGNENRQVPNLRAVSDDDGDCVWKAIEAGAETRLPYNLFQMGDVRCNRMTGCAIVGPIGDASVPVVPLFDDQCVADVRVRDLIFAHVGNVVLQPSVLALKMTRVLLTRPWLLYPSIRWVLRFLSRVGGLMRVLRFGVRTLTFVMHRFMDAKDVHVAWDLMDRGVSSADREVDAAGPRIRETMERLASCSYGMGQVGQGRVVPACAQHSVYDPDENRKLADELPRNRVSQPASDANIEVLR